MNDDFIFRGGRHNGQTYGWVRVNDPSYIRFYEEKAPFMLMAAPKAKPKPKPEPKPEPKFRDESVKSLEPNLDFWNEGPDPISLPYLKKMEEGKTIKKK